MLDPDVFRRRVSLGAFHPGFASLPHLWRTVDLFVYSLAPAPPPHSKEPLFGILYGRICRDLDCHLDPAYGSQEHMAEVAQKVACSPAFQSQGPRV